MSVLLISVPHPALLPAAAFFNRSNPSAHKMIHGICVSPFSYLGSSCGAAAASAGIANLEFRSRYGSPIGVTHVASLMFLCL